MFEKLRCKHEHIHLAYKHINGCEVMYKCDNCGKLRSYNSKAKVYSRWYTNISNRGAQHLWVPIESEVNSNELSQDN